MKMNEEEEATYTTNDFEKYPYEEKLNEVAEKSTTEELLVVDL